MGSIPFLLCGRPKTQVMGRISFIIVTWGDIVQILYFLFLIDVEECGDNSDGS